MAEIVNNDKLVLILTQYGLSRVAEAMADPFLNLNITKIKFGSGNNYEYYMPSESQTSLKGPLDTEFYIYKKELLEDGLTTSFYTMIPENIGGFDIREVGLYETVNDEDRLFAIGTCQPFVKPTTADNYFIAVDYYIFLKSANFASVYDQITLDPEHALVTEPDMEEMMRTFLFSNANLIQQIGNNSRFIGYNRATQLYEKIVENKTSFSYLTLYKNYASLLGMSSENSIFSFWAFDISRRMQSQNSIVDLSQNANYMSTTIPVSSLERVYNGFMSMFSMKDANFYLSSNTPVQLFNDVTASDIYFTVAFALKPLSTHQTRTLLAKSNYATGSHTFEFNELADGSLQIKLFTDASNYLTFTSDTNVIPQGCQAVVLSYDPTRREFTGYINANKITFERTETGTYTHMKELPGTLYYFSCTPTYLGYANSDSDPSVIYNSDGTPYTGTEWTAEDSILKYEGNPASYSSADNLLTDQLYAWYYDDGENEHVIYTKVAPAASGQSLSEPWATLYNKDYTIYTGDDFTVNGDLVEYRNEHTMVYEAPYNPPRITLYAWKYEAPVEAIYANKVSSPTSFYDIENRDLYLGTDWTVVNGDVYYLGQLAIHDASMDTNTLYPNLTSYITDENGNISQPIDAEVGVVSIVKDKMEEEKVRALSLLLCATMGTNPYISGS